LRSPWFALLLLILTSCHHQSEPSGGRHPAPLGLVELQVAFAEGIAAAGGGFGDRPASHASLGPLTGVTAASAATLAPHRVDFEVTSASLINRGSLHYLALEVAVTNRSGRTLRNLTMLAYRSSDGALGESALTHYQGSSAHTAAAAARVTPFAAGMLPEDGEPLRLSDDVRLSTVLYAQDDPAFNGLRAALAEPPYRAFVADLFPYGFVAAGEGLRTLAPNATATLHLGFRVLPNTSEFRWRAVLVEDPQLRLGLPADFNERATGAGERDNLLEFLERLTRLLAANPGESVAGVVLGSVDHQPGARVVMVHDDQPVAATVPLRSAFAAGLLTVEALADISISSGPHGANGWLNQTGVSEVYLLERYAAVGAHVFETPLPPGRANLPVEAVVVGGGGGGGRASRRGGGGGGGAGGVLEGVQSLVGGTYPVTVGAGGTGSLASDADGTQGADGLPSSFLAWTALGGGGGGDSTSAGRTGASGGGAGREVGGSPPAAGGALQGQGFPGGNVAQQRQGLAAGGGGAASAGGDSSDGAAGGGGAGVVVGISGASVPLGGGGGGGAASGRGAAGPGGAGGAGAGGVGGPGQAAAPGSGSGGGGGGGDGSLAASGGDGGSGVVMVRYALAPVR